VEPTEYQAGSSRVERAEREASIQSLMPLALASGPPRRWTRVSLILRELNCYPILNLRVMSGNLQHAQTLPQLPSSLF
jgi:hypothetical protein